MRNYNRSKQTRRAVTAIVVAVAYFLAAFAALSLARLDGGTAIVWPASGLLIAVLSISSRSQWTVLLCFAVCAGAVASLRPGLGGNLGPALAVLSVAEAGLAAWLIKTWYPRFGRFRSFEEVFRFIVVAGGIAPALFSAIVATLVHKATGAGYWFVFEDWFGAHALGNLVFAPPILLVLRKDLRRRMRASRGRASGDALLLLLLVALGSLLAFGQGRIPLVMLPVLAILAATFRLGRFGAVTSILVLIVIGLSCTLLGFGPTTLLPGAIGSKLQVLQIYFASVILLVLPIAANLEASRWTLARLRETERLHLMLLDQTSDVVLRIDVTGIVRYVSPSVERVWRYRPDEVIGHPAGHLLHPDDLPGARRERRRVLAQPGFTGAVEYRICRRDASTIWVESHMRATLDEFGRANGTVSVIREITDRRRAREALEARANTDPLTGLANRRAFDEALVRELHLGHSGSCVALFDLDHFKNINDRFGHMVGDDVLVRFAEVLRGVTRECDLVARFGGEEFAVLLRQLSIPDAMQVGERARAGLEALDQHDVHGTRITMTVSAGVAPIVGDARGVMSVADAALYQAKHQGRNRVVLMPGGGLPPL